MRILIVKLQGNVTDLRFDPSNRIGDVNSRDRTENRGGLWSPRLSISKLLRYVGVGNSENFLLMLIAEEQPIVDVVEGDCALHRLSITKHSAFVFCFEGLWSRRG